MFTLVSFNMPPAIRASTRWLSANAEKSPLLNTRIVSLDVEQPRQYHFEPRAQELFIDWYTRLQQRLRSPELHPALISHLSKYAKLMPSLGVLFELVIG